MELNGSNGVSSWIFKGELCSICELSVRLWTVDEEIESAFSIARSDELDCVLTTLLIDGLVAEWDGISSALCPDIKIEEHFYKLFDLTS